MNACWCGSLDFRPFNAQYEVCVACGTLVSQAALSAEQLTVRDDEVDFYGKQYWLAHQASDLGFPDIHARALNDLSERNLHWLRTLIKYRPPAATAIELGCAHGSFVALMQQAGYDARGVEMSPWVVDFGRKTFGVPVDVGPIEGLPMEAGTVDVVALMDVLEHLPDPVGTMRHCLGLLKPDGILLIQTPCFEPGMNYEALTAARSPFLDQLKFDEHLYLFTRDSARRLFTELGAEHLAFEPAIFAQYDMFFVVGKSPLKAYPEDQSLRALLATSSGHLIKAMLDLRERELSLTGRFALADTDRAERGEQIVTLTALLQASESDRLARAEQIARLDGEVRAIDRDRVQRGEQIDLLTRLLEQAEADRSARAEQIVVLENLLQEAEADRAARGLQITTLTDLLKESEADRAARAEQIEALTRMVHEARSGRKD